MATSFPGNLDSLTNPTAGDPLNVPSHADQHANANDAIEALEAKVGKNSSAVTTSHDYKIDALEGRADSMDDHTHTGADGTDKVKCENLDATTGNVPTNSVGTASIEDDAVTIDKIYNPYKCSVYRNGSQTGIADSTWTTVELNAENYDINNNFDTSTYTYTVPITGYYYVHGSCYLTGTALYLTALRLLKEAGSTIVVESQNLSSVADGPGSQHATLSGILYLSSGDTLKLQVYGDVTSGTCSTEDLKRYNFMDIHLLST